MDLSDFVNGAIVATSTTVATSKITINAPARVGMRVYLIWASFSTDLVGAFDAQGGVAGATSKLQQRTQVAVAAYVNPNLEPAMAIPISDSGIEANFVLNVTTTGRLSVVYGYGP